MLSKKIDIGHHAQEFIEFRWTQGFSAVEVYFRDQRIGGFDGKEELFKGKTFSLYGDETLFIGFSWKHASFVVRRNGTYVAGSPYHPRHHMAPLVWIGALLGTIYFLAGFVQAFWNFVFYYSDYNDTGILGTYQIFVGITGTLYIVVPLLLKNGYYYWYYIVIAFTVFFIALHTYALFFFGYVRMEDIYVMFFINLPALIMGVLFITYRKLIRELGNERARRLNFEKVIS